MASNISVLVFKGSLYRAENGYEKKNFGKGIKKYLNELQNHPLLIRIIVKISRK